MTGTPQERVEAALRAVRDPTLDVDVFEAGLVDDIRIDDDVVTIEADLEEFDLEAERQVMAAMMDAAASVEGIERAHVEHAVPATDGRTAGVADVDRVIAVASAKGGVGKTTVAVNLACALAADAAVGLFDADIHGPNAPAMLDIAGPVYSDDEGRPLPVDAGGLEVMSVGLMEEGAPLAWRGAMAHDALTKLFEDTAWRDRETLVVDLPPGTGDVVLTTLQEVPVDGVVFVTTPFHAAVTDTGRSIELFRENEVPVLGVVANMTTYVCPSCGDAHDLFPRADPLDVLDAPVLAELPFSGEFQGHPSTDSVPDAFADLAAAVRERLDSIWNPELPDEALDLRGLPAEERTDRVAAAFTALQTGERFVLVSDRDPSPVQSYVAELADVDANDPALEPIEVRQVNPDTWVFEATRP